MIDPSPENQAFAKAQADFLPSPDGRGQTTICGIFGDK